MKTITTKYTIDLINSILFSKDSILTAISFEPIRKMPSGQNYKTVLCICKCGAKVVRGLSGLTMGKFLSCGCIGKANQLKAIQKHFPVIPKLNRIWYSMIARCYDPTHDSYKFYGGIGVIVCVEWLNSYQSFLDWAVANGYKEGLQIDKDTKGTGKLYSPEMCCWITPKENQRARKHLTKVNYKGEDILLVELCERYGIKCDIVRQRMKRNGMTLEQAVTTPNTGIGNFKLRSKERKQLK